MPFDPAGNFSRVHSWQEDRDNGIRILADRHDAEDDNFSGAFNLTFLRTGTVPMTGNLQMGGNSIHNIQVGSEAAPSLTWELSNQTGIWQPNPLSLAVSSNGVKKFEVNGTGVGIFGDTAFNGNVTVSAQATVKALDVRDGTWPIVQISKNAVGYWRLGPVEPSNNFGISLNGAAPSVIVGTDSSLAVGGPLTVAGSGTFNGSSLINGGYLAITSPVDNDGYVRLTNTVASFGVGMLGAAGWSRFSVYDILHGAERFNIQADGKVNVYGALSVDGATNVNNQVTINYPGAGLSLNSSTAYVYQQFMVNNARKAFVGFGAGNNDFYINNDTAGGFVFANSGGMVRQFISPEGNVGIGTTLPGSYGNYTCLSVHNDVGGGLIECRNTVQTLRMQCNGALNPQFGTVSAHPLEFMTSGVPRLLFHAAGGVGLNETCSNITKTNNDGSLNIGGGTTLSDGACIILRGSYQASPYPGAIEFHAGDQVRGLINLYGKHFIGQTAALIGSIVGSGNLRVECAAEESSMAICTHGPGAHYALQVVAGGSHVGGVATDGSATQFLTMSDGRMKDNVRNCDDAGEVLDRVNIVAFDFPDTGYHVPFGVVAQELKEIYPSAVYTPPENPTSPDQDFWGVDYSKLVPMLVKELQSLRSRMAYLEGYGARSK